MPKSKQRKRPKERKKQITPFMPQEYSLRARWFKAGELSFLINSSVFMFIGMYAMSKTDKLSLETKLTVDFVQLSILLTMGINSGLIEWAHYRKRHVKWLEQRVLFGYLCGFALYWVASYMSLRMLKYPEQIDELIRVKFPNAGRSVSSAASKTATFLTSGVMGLVTTVVLNVLSSYIFMALRRNKSDK